MTAPTFLTVMGPVAFFAFGIAFQLPWVAVAFIVLSVPLAIAQRVCGTTRIRSTPSRKLPSTQPTSDLRTPFVTGRTR